MQVLIHGLSSTNLSGRQVLCGHLVELLRQTGMHHRFTLLLHAGNRDVVALFKDAWGEAWPANLVVEDAPASTSGWAGRALFDHVHLPRIVRRNEVEVLLTLTGGFIHGLACRQYTLALNPRPFIPAALPNHAAKAKAVLQRFAMKQAVLKADGIGYASGFMRDLYRRHAGCSEKRGAMVYAALSDREIRAMEEIRALELPRESMTIVCVSLMAPLKNIETLVQALHRLHKHHACPARLRLVGGWSYDAYRERIVTLIRQLDLESYVELTGHVPRAELLRACATARVYALLSRSESFGIPSVEAQWMGTPVVAAKGCAAPEICGDGGLYVEPDDAIDAAEHLAALLQDDARWRNLAACATENARRFQYVHTSKPLIELMDL